MTTGRIRILRRFTEGKGVLKKVIDRVSDLKPALRAAGRVMQMSIREEFLGVFWYRPEGGTMAWPARKDDKSHPLLRETGALMSAWTDILPRVTSNTVSVGVQGEEAVRGRVHRGGSGNIVSTHSIWNNIPPRPHATRNPKMDLAVKAAFLRHIKGAR